jgi:phospholipase/carboxylesterase
VSEPERLHYVVRPAAAEPAGALVLLHGRGADEHDLVPLLDALDPKRRLVGVTPRGPLALPPGGAHWYVVPRVGYPDRDTFMASFRLLSEFFDALPTEVGVDWEQTVLGGFSQGAVMAYSLGLGPQRPSPAGVIALSGFIPVVEGFDLELEGREGFPVAIGHGILDPIIGIDFARRARERLEAAGLSVTYRESPLPHAIEPSFVRELQEWIPAVLGADQITTREA